MTAQLNPRGDVAVLVPAAGLGVRLGPGGPKALRHLAGEPLLVHAVRRIAAAESVALIVVAAPPADLEAVRELLAPVAPVTVVAGGAERQGSVAAALAVVPAEIAIVLVHDAARALTPATLIDEVAAAVRAGRPAVIPVLPVVDTIKEVAPEEINPAGAGLEGVGPGEAGLGVGGAGLGGAGVGGVGPAGAGLGIGGVGLEGVGVGRVGPAEVGLGGVGPGQAGLGEIVRATIDRAALRSVQTPQGFRHDVLVAAHGAGLDPHTDDAGLVEKAGVPVACIPGSELAMKITRPLDLIIAEALFQAEAATTPG